MNESLKISPLMRRNLVLLLFLSTVLRTFLAGLLEFGNDEVYYFTYALFPDLSYFDHPPMVAFIIRLFTFNLHFTQEFFVRLGAVAAGTLNTWLMFCIGRLMKDELTGWYSALLYTASIYGFIIAGVFILPDAPQSVFWLFSLYLLLKALPDKDLSAESRKLILLASLTMGLAMLSKYTSAFLIIGTVAYIAIYNRKWLMAKEVYLAAIIVIFLFSPVLIWNSANHFISFGYQGGRAGIFSEGLNLLTFLTELGGQFLYNNPVNVILIIWAVLKICRHRAKDEQPLSAILLLTALPLILTFLVISLFRPTLPHWTGMAYTTLIPLSALYLRQKYENRFRMLNRYIFLSTGFLLVILIAGVFQIKTGWLNKDKEHSMITELGRNDPSLDMFGWHQLRDKMPMIVERDIRNGIMDPNAVFISFRWFPLSNIDYYIARPMHRKVFGIGKLKDLHFYAWINELRGGFRRNMDAYYITSGRDYKDPLPLYCDYFQSIEPCDTIPVVRGGRVAMYFLIYRMHNLKKLPAVYPVKQILTSIDVNR